MISKFALASCGLAIFRSPIHAADTKGDPFAGIEASTRAAADGGAATWWSDNFGFRKELLSQFATSDHGPAASRQSAGFELLKKFSTEIRTLGSLNFQGRLVRRDRAVPVINDMEGMRREGWFFEYHNAYADLYHDPLNIRVGRFYVPFGLNVQTDTHGTLLQLSNERNFGFERDWHAGLWGALNEDFSYDAHYLAGSGYDLKYRGQSGLGVARLSLGNKHSFEHGVEGGLSLMAGERLATGPVETQRAGLDGRYRQPVPTGLLTWTSELSAGRDVPDAVFTQLYQSEYLHSSRRWGFAAQYRRFWKDRAGADGSLIGEASWYFRNDVGNSNLHWLKLNVERQLERAGMPKDLIVALQYYRYW